ncbi:hypothetical protein SNEBB_002565 [Seison nebaliae]|nr:hypothetical protein SNEBB_002565 [Seison nebaliae]
MFWKYVDMCKLEEECRHVMSIIIRPYYIVNIILSISYLMMKKVPLLCGVLFNNCHVEWRQWEMISFLAIAIVVKTRKASTWLQYLGTVITLSKLTNLILFYQESVTYASIYVLLWILFCLFLPEPQFVGKTNVIRFVRAENEKYSPFDDLLLNVEEEKKKDEEEKKEDEKMEKTENGDKVKKHQYWLIFFSSQWIPSCAQFSSIFAALSCKYGKHNQLKFGKIDVERYPKMISQLSIDIGPFTKQIPSLILFRDGKELRRRPFVDSKNKIFKFNFNQKIVEDTFELENIYESLKNNTDLPESSQLYKLKS